MCDEVRQISLTNINATFKSNGGNFFCNTTMLPLENKNYNKHNLESSDDY